MAALGFATAGWSSLSISSSAAPSFSVSINGTDQTSTYPLTFTVASNGNANWHVNASSTQFVNGTHTFPTNASSVVTVPTPPCGSNCPGLTPTGSVVYPVTLPNSGGSSIYSVGGNTDGNFALTATVQVATPANIYTGTYTSTVTLQAVVGP
jgi:hypothetical protein